MTLPYAGLPRTRRLAVQLERESAASKEKGEHACGYYAHASGLGVIATPAATAAVARTSRLIRWAERAPGKKTKTRRGPIAKITHDRKLLTPAGRLIANRCVFRPPRARSCRGMSTSPRTSQRACDMSRTMSVA